MKLTQGRVSLGLKLTILLLLCLDLPGVTPKSLQLAEGKVSSRARRQADDPEPRSSEEEAMEFFQPLVRVLQDIPTPKLPSADTIWSWLPALRKLLFPANETSTPRPTVSLEEPNAGSTPAPKTSASLRAAVRKLSVSVQPPVPEIPSSVQPPRLELPVSIQPQVSELESSEQPPRLELPLSIQPRVSELESSVQPPRLELPVSIQPRVSELESSVQPPRLELPVSIQPQVSELESSVQPSADELFESIEEESC